MIAVRKTHSRSRPTRPPDCHPTRSAAICPLLSLSSSECLISGN